jgi:hypothetical protein
MKPTQLHRRQLPYDERHRRVVIALRSGGPQLSAPVRQRLLAQEQWLVRRAPRDRSFGMAARRWVRVPATAMMLALVAGLLAWQLEHSRTPAVPTISQTAQLAFMPRTAGPPAVDPGDPSALHAQVGDVHFPNYQPGFGVAASGQRTDVTGGRTVRTVYYTLPGGARLSYSIVSGAPLVPPAGARREIVSGIVLRSYHEGDLSVVTLVRSGRTCVLAAPIPGATVLALATAPLLRVSRT